MYDYCRYDAILANCSSNTLLVLLYSNQGWKTYRFNQAVKRNVDLLQL